jgi:hypothetical protein
MVPAPQNPIRPLLLAPSEAGIVSVSWENWCGPNPGPLDVEVEVPLAAGTAIGPFDKPAVVPGCNNPGSPSELLVVNAYFPSP